MRTEWRSAAGTSTPSSSRLPDRFPCTHHQSPVPENLLVQLGLDSCDEERPVQSRRVRGERDQVESLYRQAQAPSLDRSTLGHPGSGTRGSVNRRVITSIDEFDDATRARGIDPIQVRPGGVRADLTHADLGPLVADAVYSSLPLALRGKTVADRVWMVAPMNRTASGQLNGEPLTPENVLVFGGSVEVVGASGAPFLCGILSIAPSALQRTATALDIKSHPPGKGEFRVVPVVDRGRLSRAFDLLSHAVYHERDVALTRDEAKVFERAFLEIAVSSLAGDSTGSSPNKAAARLRSAEIAGTCEEYARRSRFQDVTLADLCQASHVSERRVRSAFYECYQMSPTAYLRVTALNAVRRQLLHGPQLRDAVSRAATDWGFWHLSRFAAQYRALFGESPSATLSHGMDRPLRRDRTPGKLHASGVLIAG